MSRRDRATAALAEPLRPSPSCRRLDESYETVFSRFVGELEKLATQASPPATRAKPRSPKKKGSTA